MSEVLGLETWLYGLLNGDTGTGGVSTLVAGRIYTDEAPSGSVYPLVLLSAQSPGIDVVSIGPHRVIVNTLYWVRVVGKGASKVALEAIFDRIDVLLQAAGGVTTKVRVLMVNREQTLLLPPATVDGVRYVQLGALWRCYLQAP